MDNLTLGLTIACIAMLLVIAALGFVIYEKCDTIKFKKETIVSLMKSLNASEKLNEAYRRSEVHYERMIKIYEGASYLFDIWLTCEKRFRIPTEVNLFFLIAANTLRYREGNEVTKSEDGQVQTTTRFLEEAVEVKLPDGDKVEIDRVMVSVSPAHTVDVMFQDKFGAIHPIYAFEPTDLIKVYMVLNTEDDED